MDLFCLLLKVQVLLLSGFLSCKFNLHKCLYFLHRKQRVVGSCGYRPPRSFWGKLPSFWCGCWRAIARERTVTAPSPQQSDCSGVGTWLR